MAPVRKKDTQMVPPDGEEEEEGAAAAAAAAAERPEVDDCCRCYGRGGSVRRYKCEKLLVSFTREQPILVQGDHDRGNL